MEANELAWLAGILEGEGCFRSETNGVPGYRFPRITLDMTDQDVVERAAKLMGVKCNTKNSPSIRNKGHQVKYVARINGRKALALMQDLYPWLGKRRREKVDEIIDAMRGTWYDASHDTDREHYDLPAGDHSA